MVRSWNLFQKKNISELLYYQDLKASSQCTQAYNKANKILGLNNRNIVYKSKSILLPLYKSLVRTHLEYCVVVWSPHYHKDKLLLERIQRCFTRMIPGLKKLPHNSRLKELKLWSLACWLNRDLQDDTGSRQSTLANSSHEMYNVILEDTVWS